MIRWSQFVTDLSPTDHYNGDERTAFTQDGGSIGMTLAEIVGSLIYKEVNDAAYTVDESDRGRVLYFTGGGNNTVVTIPNTLRPCEIAFVQLCNTLSFTTDAAPVIVPSGKIAKANGYGSVVKLLNDQSISGYILTGDLQSTGPKIMSYFLSQSGGGSPSVTIIQNDFGVSVNATRISNGRYRIDYGGDGLLGDKTVCRQNGFVIGKDGHKPALLIYETDDLSGAFIRTSEYTSEPSADNDSDGYLDNQLIEVLVYPILS